MRNLEIPDNTFDVILHSRLSQLLESRLGLQKDQLKSIRECLDEFLHFEENIDDYLGTVVGRKFFKDFDEFLERRFVWKT